MSVSCDERVGLVRTGGRPQKFWYTQSRRGNELLFLILVPYHHHLAASHGTWILTIARESVGGLGLCVSTAGYTSLSRTRTMTWSLSALLCLVVAAVPLVLAGAEQVHLSTGRSVVAGTNDISLASITDVDSFVALTHPSFPAHQVRVKKTEFCDPTVKYVLEQVVVCVH